MPESATPTASDPDRSDGPRDVLKDLRFALRETVVQGVEDGLPARGAALSFYVLLSLGPMLVLVVGALELFLSGAPVRAGVVTTVRDNLGPRAADMISTVLAQAQPPDLLAPESLLTVALLVFGATAAFANVRGSINTIWGVEPDDASHLEMIVDFLRARVRGFVMIVVTGLVIAISFLVSSSVGVLANLLEDRFAFGGLVVRSLDAGVSLLVLGLLFGAIYQTLPAVRVRWGTVWTGAFATALMFVLGKYLVAWLIASASWTSYYGPGASVVAFLAWIYFSAQIFFLGAEFTQVWSRRRGGVIGDA